MFTYGERAEPSQAKPGLAQKSIEYALLGLCLLSDK